MAGYQTAIITYCDQKQIGYAIRAKISAYLKDMTLSIPDSDWQPLLDRKGDAIAGHSTCQALHTTGDYERAFTVVAQRKPLRPG